MKVFFWNVLFAAKNRKKIIFFFLQEALNFLKQIFNRETVKLAIKTNYLNKFYFYGVRYYF